MCVYINIYKCIYIYMYTHGSYYYMIAFIHTINLTETI